MGRKKIHDSGAERVAAYRAENTRRRIDAYLNPQASDVLTELQEATGSSTGEALSDLLTSDEAATYLKRVKG